MIKVLPWCLEQCLMPVATFPLQECSQTATLWHWSNSIPRSHKLPKYWNYEPNFFFSECAKFCVDCENIKGSWKNVFHLSVNGVWTLCENFSQTMTRIHMICSQYVTKQSETSDLTNRDLFQLNVSKINGNIW